MFKEYFGDLAGVRVEGSGGLVFPHDRSTFSEGGALESSLRPNIDLQVLSEGRHRVWCPIGKMIRVKLDTGADHTCLHTETLLSLGLRNEISDTKGKFSIWRILGRGEETKNITKLVDASGNRIPSHGKFVTIRISGFHEYIFPIWVNYSRRFRPNLFNISLGALAPYFRIVLTDAATLVFPIAASDRERRRETRAADDTSRPTGHA
jgi:hypothetical protein